MLRPRSGAIVVDLTTSQIAPEGEYSSVLIVNRAAAVRLECRRRRIGVEQTNRNASSTRAKRKWPCQLTGEA